MVFDKIETGGERYIILYIYIYITTGAKLSYTVKVSSSGNATDVLLQFATRNPRPMLRKQRFMEYDAQVTWLS